MARRSTDAWRRDAELFLETVRLTPRLSVDELAEGWARADAAALVQLAKSEGALLLLQRRLRALGITVSGDAGVRLAAEAKRAIAQQMRGDVELGVTMTLLERAQIPAVPLKGAAMRRLGPRVPYADARSSADIDVITPVAVAQRAWDALVAQGYTAPKPGPPDGHHLPVLIGASGVGVEIHLSTTAALDADEAWRRATTDSVSVVFQGRSLQIPNDTELLWHSVTHALVHATESGQDGVRIRHWMDAAALLAAKVPITWPVIADRLRSNECARPALAASWIATAAEIAGVALPDGALGDVPAEPLAVSRLLAWRLRVAAASPPRAWEEKLLEEGARGEIGAPMSRGRSDRAWIIRQRHRFAARAARAWWLLRR